MQKFDTNFINADDFVRCIQDGCEVEFIYDNTTYFVTAPEKNILVGEANNEDSLREFCNPAEALSYPIGGKRLGDILKDMRVIFRSF